MAACGCGNAGFLIRPGARIRSIRPIKTSGKNVSQHYLQAEDLWAQVEQRSRQALASGALHPIASQARLLRDGGIDFVVRVITNLARKAQAIKAGDSSQPAKDPFLPPYEPDLYVGDLSPTHVALLNKFNVLDHHLLIVTRAFEDQRRWLTLADFRRVGCGHDR